MKFLFWNLNQCPLQALTSELVHDLSVDLLLICECAVPVVDFLEALNRDREYKYSLAFSPSKYVLIFSRLPEGSLKPIQDTDRVSIREIFPPIGESILLAVVHLPSKLYQRDIDQVFLCTEIARLIGDAERKVGHERTVIVGDFNMNPFEEGLVGAPGLHAIMDKEIVKRIQRSVQGKSYPFFYNPMWGHLGDSTLGPPGTYFYDGSGYLNYFWNTFDQVLVRPALLPYFRNEELRVITATKTVRLLSERGLPDPKVGSDHLPIAFNINIEGGLRNGV